MGTGSFPVGEERPGRDADPSLLSSVVGHERVELYLYSTYGAVRPVQSLSACIRVTFTFFLHVSALFIRLSSGRKSLLRKLYNT